MNFHNDIAVRCRQKHFKQIRCPLHHGLMARHSHLPKPVPRELSHLSSPLKNHSQSRTQETKLRIVQTASRIKTG